MSAVAQPYRVEYPNRIRTVFAVSAEAASAKAMERWGTPPTRVVSMSPAALAPDYRLHSVDCARHAADVPCSRACRERARLEVIRAEIEAERVSYGELAELQSLAAYIDPGDVLLLEWAGVPEHPEQPCTCEQWFHAADDDDDRDGHVHRDAGDGCTAPGCACEHNAGVTA